VVGRWSEECREGRGGESKRVRDKEIKDGKRYIYTYVYTYIHTYIHIHMHLLGQWFL
jgi:hypothetical protein